MGLLKWLANKARESNDRDYERSVKFEEEWKTIEYENKLNSLECCRNCEHLVTDSFGLYVCEIDDTRINDGDIISYTCNYFERE